MEHEIITERQRETEHIIEIITSLTITTEDIVDYVLSMEGGGFDYWAEICSDDKDYEAARQRLHDRMPSPFKPCYEDVLAEILEYGGKLIVYDREEDEEHELALTDILKGWKMYAEEYKAYDFDEYDAISADCIIQYAIFGEVIYG